MAPLGHLYARSYLNQDAFECLVHGDIAEFHNEIAQLEPWTFWLHLQRIQIEINSFACLFSTPTSFEKIAFSYVCLLFRLVCWLRFHHNQIEQRVGNEGDLLGARIQNREHWRRILGVMQ